MATQRESSKKEWHSNDTIQDINSGCLQRIADATEIISKDYVNLKQKFINAESERIRYRDLFYKEQRKNSALCGVITRLTNKAKK